MLFDWFGQLTAISDVFSAITVRIKNSNLLLYERSKNELRQACLGRSMVNFGRIFMTRILVSIFLRWLSVRRKFLPNLSLSLLKALMITPTNKFMMKKATKKLKDT